MRNEDEMGMLFYSFKNQMMAFRTDLPSVETSYVNIGAISRKQFDKLFSDFCAGLFGSTLTLEKVQELHKKFT